MLQTNYKIVLTTYCVEKKFLNQNIRAFASVFSYVLFERFFASPFVGYLRYQTAPLLTTDLVQNCGWEGVGFLKGLNTEWMVSKTTEYFA